LTGSFVLMRRVIAAYILLILAVAPNWWIYSLDASGFLPKLPSNFCSTYLQLTEACIFVSKAPIFFSLFLILAAFLFFAERLPGVKFVFSQIEAKPLRPMGVFFVLFGSCIFALPAIIVADLQQGSAQIVVTGSWCVACLALSYGLSTLFIPLNRSFRAVIELSTIFTASALVVYVADRSGEFFWLYSDLAQITFRTVALLVSFLVSDISLKPEIYQITVGSFSAEVAASCAGVYGIFLSCGAVLSFAILMRPRFHLPKIIALLPLVALVSWFMNAIRIAVLLLIGEFYSPEVAVNGFHSYAGWILFILISVSFFVIIEKLSFFDAVSYQRYTSSIFPDRNDVPSALILPFLLFLFTALITQSLFNIPESAYPFRAIILAIALIYFAPAIPRFEIRDAYLPISFGVGVSILWLSFADWSRPASAASITLNYGPIYEIAWILFRVFGTTILVPIAEELFFRRYAVDKIISSKIRFRHVISLFFTSFLFAILHGDFILAFASGVGFGLIYLRHRLVWEAILAHAIANLIIALFAVYWNDFSVI
jgi:exosortase E/protease (VPEID-CTERM system)